MIYLLNGESVKKKSLGLPSVTSLVGMNVISPQKFRASVRFFGVGFFCFHTDQRLRELFPCFGWMVSGGPRKIVTAVRACFGCAAFVAKH